MIVGLIIAWPDGYGEDANNGRKSDLDGSRQEDKENLYFEVRCTMWKSYNSLLSGALLMLTFMRNKFKIRIFSCRCWPPRHSRFRAHIIVHLVTADFQSAGQANYPSHSSSFQNIPIYLIMGRFEKKADVVCWVHGRSLTRAVTR